MQSSKWLIQPTKRFKYYRKCLYKLVNANIQSTIYQKNIIAVVASGIWWCDQQLAEIAACRALHLHIPCKAVAVTAAADEIARDARVSFGSKLEWVDIVIIDHFETCRRHETTVSSIVGALQSTHALVLNAMLMPRCT